jgi:hypothetical protein
VIVEDECMISLFESHVEAGTIMLGCHVFCICIMLLGSNSSR